MIFKNKSKALLFFIFIVLVSIILFHYKNQFHIYYIIRAFITSDQEFNQLPNIAGFNPIQEEHYIYNNSNEDFKINWRFRPEHINPIYPKIIAKDIDQDGIKEIYLASQTKKIYELNALNGNLKRSWEFPIGQSSSNGSFIYKKNNNFYLFTTSTISLPIRAYSLDLNSDEIKIDWQRNLHGQFVEAGINYDDNDKIIVATRDAPYSPGSLYIFDIYGNKIFGPEKKLDVCASKPIISGEYFYHGSHKFYNAEYGNTIIKRQINTGNIIWKKKLNFDTGFLTSSIVDYNKDGNEEVIVYESKPDEGIRNSVILDANSGEIIDISKGFILDYLNNNKIVEKLIDYDNLYLIKDQLRKLPQPFLSNYLKTGIFANKNLSFPDIIYSLSRLNNGEDLALYIYEYFNHLHSKPLFLKEITFPSFFSNKKENKIYFMDQNFNLGENFFITINNKLKKMTFHIFNVFKDFLIYQKINQDGKLLNLHIEHVGFNSENNNFLNKFYKNSEVIPLPSIYISTISDLDNDNKLEVLLGIEDTIISYNLDIEEKINYDGRRYPNIQNNNLIFYLD